MNSGTSTKKPTTLPDYAGKLGMSDMYAMGPDGKPHRKYLEKWAINPEPIKLRRRI